MFRLNNFNKNYIYIILNFIWISLLISSCHEKKSKANKENAPTIEIYYPKQRIQSYSGIKLPPKIDITSRPFSVMDSVCFHHIRYDTIKNRPIFAGQFNATTSDLRSEPIISDSEILGFDFDTNSLILNKSGAAKIFEQESNFWCSNQFIITSDRKPILTGYFYNILFSSFSYVDAYQIEYDTYEIEHVSYNKSIENKIEVYRFVIRRYPLIDGIHEYYKLPDLNSNSQFYKAFENRSNGLE